jgi:Zn-dependent peptidase ImmA (M78 family)/DNA-binding XRE family transcriptional regulator
MERFNPGRLDLARRRRGLTKSNLAERAGVSTSVLRAYERRDRDPSEVTIKRLAAVLDFPVAFLRGDDIDEPSVDGVSFRALSSMTARQRDQACGAAAIAVQLDDWIRARFDLPVPDVPKFRDAQPEAAAETVRHVWGLGERRAPNMVHLLEAHGVRVFSLAQDCAEVDAFSFWQDGLPYVFLNSQKSAERSRMDAAHELGHLVMHSHGSPPSGRTAEDQAQTFGSAYLMPRRSVLVDAPRGGTVSQIIMAKRRWSVSAMNLTHRMHKLGLLTDWQVRSAYIQLGRLGYRQGEPDGIERESSQILPKVFAALREEGKTRGDIAQALHIPVDEINRAVCGLVVARGGDIAIASAPLPPTTRRPELRIVV